MAEPTAIGVTLVTNASTQTLDITSKGEVKILTNNLGVYSKAAVLDPTFEFSATGKGEACPVTIGSTLAVPDGVTGTSFITSVKNATSNDDWETWEYSGVAYPGFPVPEE